MPTAAILPKPVREAIEAHNGGSHIHSVSGKLTCSCGLLFRCLVSHKEDAHDSSMAEEKFFFHSFTTSQTEHVFIVTNP